MAAPPDPITAEEAAIGRGRLDANPRPPFYWRSLGVEEADRLSHNERTAWRGERHRRRAQQQQEAAERESYPERKAWRRSHKRCQSREDVEAIFDEVARFLVAIGEEPPNADEVAIRHEIAAAAARDVAAGLPVSGLWRELAHLASPRGSGGDEEGVSEREVENRSLAANDAEPLLAWSPHTLSDNELRERLLSAGIISPEAAAAAATAQAGHEQRNYQERPCWRAPRPEQTIEHVEAAIADNGSPSHVDRGGGSSSSDSWTAPMASQHWRSLLAEAEGLEDITVNYFDDSEDGDDACLAFSEQDLKDCDEGASRCHSVNGINRRDGADDPDPYWRPYDIVDAEFDPELAPQHSRNA